MRDAEKKACDSDDPENPVKVDNWQVVFDHFAHLKPLANFLSDTGPAAGNAYCFATITPIVG